MQIGDVVAVVTQPDRAKGRGGQVGLSPVKELALARGIPVLQPEKLRGSNFAAQLSAYQLDVGVVTAYGKILPKDVLEAPKKGCVNVHASLLPRWRGAAPIQRALAAGDDKTGVCLMQMDPGLDTGPVIACRAIPIKESDTSESLHNSLSQLGRALIIEELPRFLDGERMPIPQPEKGVTLAPPLRKEDGELQFDRAGVELERMIRAFVPWPGTFVHFNGSTLKIHRARIGSGSGQPGEILAADSTGIEVACKTGSLYLLELQPEGKRRMNAAEFLAGRTLAAGSIPFGK